MSKQKKTLVVGLWAGPGAGKSTGAAYIYSKLKMAGVSCELATEYAKDRVWQRDSKAIDHQFFISANQSMRIARLLGEVDVIVTDSPLLMGAIYAEKDSYCDDLRKVLRSIYNETPHMDFFIRRCKAFEQHGRIQNQEESMKLDEKILKFLDGESMGKYLIVDGDIGGYDKVVEEILNVYKKEVE